MLDSTVYAERQLSYMGPLIFLLIDKAEKKAQYNGAYAGFDQAGLETCRYRVLCQFPKIHWVVGGKTLALLDSSIRGKLPSTFVRYSFMKEHLENRS